MEVKLNRTWPAVCHISYLWKAKTISCTRIMLELSSYWKAIIRVS